MHYEYPDGALITVKKLNVECWRLLILNGHHFGHIAQGEEGDHQSVKMAAKEAAAVTIAMVTTAHKRLKVKTHSFLLIFNEIELKSSEQTFQRATIMVKFWR